MDDESEDGDDDEVEDDSGVSDHDEEKQDLVASLDVNGVGNRLKNSEEREESDSEPSDLDDKVLFKFDKHLAQIFESTETWSLLVLTNPSSLLHVFINSCTEGGKPTSCGPSGILGLGSRSLRKAKNLSAEEVRLRADFVIYDVAAALEALETPAPPKGRLKSIVTKLLELLGQKI
ncbi:hypothetical protein R1sor_024867 [Riccia sorocarpa]|uniref:Uncharacterized protein n=1 Tax=Riccia sorocarpa TaxID=122646 RepID=A0ABD3GVU0_9MARC